MVLDGLVVLTEAVVRYAKATQVCALALAVADLPADGQRLGVVLDGLVVLTEAVVRVAESILTPAAHSYKLHAVTPKYYHCG